MSTAIEKLIGAEATRVLSEAGYEVVLRPSAKVTIPWACPKCKADASGHGQGPCADEKESLCSGFICECSSDESDTDGHGDTYRMPCKEAHCYHCGWQGVFPKPPSKAAPWEKKALEAGWTPTPQRAVELGLTLTQ